MVHGLGVHVLHMFAQSVFILGQFVLTWVNLFKSLATLVKSQLDKLSALSTINKPLTFDIVPSGVRHIAPHESEVYNIVMGKVHAALHEFIPYRLCGASVL